MGLIDKFKDGLREGIEKANPQASASDLRIAQELIERRLREEPPPRLAVVGESGVGKSSTINALFNAGVDVSHTRACTRDGIHLTIDLGTSDEGIPRLLEVMDMPGLGESIKADKRNLEVYEQILPSVDVVVWIIDAQNRAIRGVQERLSLDLLPRFPEAMKHLVVGINKVDLVDPGPDAWNPTFNLPGESQAQNIEGREADISEKLAEALGGWSPPIVSYSAIKRFRLATLFQAMVQAVRSERRWILGDRMDLASFEELVDERILRTVKRQAADPT